MYKNGRYMAVLLAALLSIFSSAQSNGQISKAPKWVQKAPVEKNTYVSIVSVPKFSEEMQLEPGSAQSIFAVGTPKPTTNYVDSAKYKAFYKLTQELPWEIDHESLLYELARRGVKVQSIEKYLIPLMYEAPEFVQRGIWEDDLSYWCFYSITSSAFNSFLERISNDIFMRAENLYRQGIAYRNNGYPIKAATCFSQALDVLQPLMFKSFPVDGNDLGKTILNSFVTVYDGIVIEPQYNSIPAVFGEPLPVDVRVRVKQNGKLLRNIAIYSKFAGESEPATTTDADGTSALKVTKVRSNAPVQTITFGIDQDAMFDVGTSVADALFRKQSLPQVAVELHLFDPSIFVKVVMSAEDSDLIGAVSDIIAKNRPDMKLVNDEKKADLIFRIKQTTNPIGTFSNEKYSLKTYSSDLSIEVVTASDGKVQNSFEKKDFKYVAKGSRSEDVAFHSISRQFSHIIVDDLQEFVKRVEYFKRDIVWSKYL